MRQLVLLESGHRHPHSPSGAGVVSIGVHLAVIALAIVVTAQPPQHRDPDSAPRIYFASPQPAPAASAQSAEQRTSQTRPAARPRLPQLSDMQAKVSADIPDVLPLPGATVSDPSVLRELNDPSAGLAITGADVLASPGAGWAYRSDQVEVPAAFLPNQQPDYPEPLRRDGVAGRVRVRFVVGASGRVQGRPEILAATHPAFAASVHSFLARARYRPARIGETPVAQLVEQEFVFSVRR